MGLGALYGLLRGMAPSVSTGRGALYGLATFILKDEVANTVLGTGGSPLDYPAQDHARGAAAHTLFGVATDLGTRLLAPWRNEVVVYRGPPLSERIEHGRQYLDEHGRRYLEQGRQYLDQGLEYADKYGRKYLKQGREYADQGRRYAGEYAEQGRRSAGEYADQAQRHARSYADQGRRYAGQLASDARARVPEVDSSDLKRAKKWIRNLLG